MTATNSLASQPRGPDKVMEPYKRLMAHSDGDLRLQPPLLGEPGLAAAGRRHRDHAHQRSARWVILTLLTLGGGTAGA